MSIIGIALTIAVLPVFVFMALQSNDSHDESLAAKNSLEEASSRADAMEAQINLLWDAVYDLNKRSDWTAARHEERMDYIEAHTGTQEVAHGRQT